MAYAIEASRRFTLVSDRNDGGGDDGGGSCGQQPAFLAHPKAVLGRAQRERQRKWKLGSSLASELPLERLDIIPRIHRQYTRKFLAAHIRLYTPIESKSGLILKGYVQSMT